MSTVTLALHGSIAVITINNPPVNALSQSVRQGLIEAVEQAEQDPRASAMVIACDGRTFIAGADIREFGKPPEAPGLPDVVERLEDSSKAVIAALHGSTLGGGLEVAMGCHYRIAMPTAVVGLPEVKLGLLPGATGTQRLPRLAGIERALAMMLSGDPISADEALDAGIIDRIADQDDLLAAAIEFAAEMTANGPRRVRDIPMPTASPDVFAASRKKIAAKTRGLLSPEKIIQCVEAATQLSYADGCKVERDLFMECKDSPQSSGLRHAFFAERSVARIPGLDKSTPTRDIRKISVLGAGTMGAGIAYNCLSAGYTVHLLDNDDAGLERGENMIRSLFDGGVKRGKISEAGAREGLGRLVTSTSYDDVADADLVIEAVFEDMSIKKTVFAKLDEVCKDGAILASNTSTLSIDEIASATRRPQDVIGLHFFSPAHIMRLLEIVRGEATGDQVIATSLALAKKLGKIGVVVGNCFGFVGNRMLYPYGRENQLLLLEGAAPEYVDKVLFDWGMAMGPNAVGDLAGLDVGYKARHARTDLPDDPRFYRVSDMLVEQGRLGQKTARGTYLYEPGSRTPIPDADVQAMIREEAARLGIEQREIDAEEIVDRCIYSLILEGARILEDGIAMRSGDIDVIWTNGYGFPRYRGGPMHYADSVGLASVYERICEFGERFGSQYWEPPQLLQTLAKTNGRFGDWVA
ncbi:MAG: 3-hydroxyacyl-CoA dehydrogenase [Gammaproteobacteria bacterium]|nr:3-hydroxyacyl-CoA dehydrogenase [Gammaproteobacteria bacterium]